MQPPSNRTPTPRVEASGIGRGQIVALGPGLQLCAPKVPASFTVSNSSGARLKARHANMHAFNCLVLNIACLCKPSPTCNLDACSTCPPHQSVVLSQAADLKVTIKGSAAVKPEVRERKDGSLEVSYTAPMSGEYRVALALGSIPVASSPFRVPCQQPRACEQHSRVEWGSGQAFAGEPYTARMTAFDQFGQRYSADPRWSRTSVQNLLQNYPGLLTP